MSAAGAGDEASISLEAVCDENLKQLKKLNSILFPVRYNDKYYADALSSHQFTKLGIIILLQTLLVLCYCLRIRCLILSFVANNWFLCYEYMLQLDKCFIVSKGNALI